MISTSTNTTVTFEDGNLNISSDAICADLVVPLAEAYRSVDQGTWEVYDESEDEVHQLPVQLLHDAVNSIIGS